MMKWIDMPPVWWIGFVLLGRWISQYDPFADLISHPIVDGIGVLFIVVGVVLMGLAIRVMRQHRTTVIPRQTASALVSSGIFKFTRNPIYLGDALVLLGLFLLWGSLLALPLVAFFVWAIERRFIIPEEEGLKEQFNAEFERYAQNTRRWI